MKRRRDIFIRVSCKLLVFLIAAAILAITAMIGKYGLTKEKAELVTSEKVQMVTEREKWSGENKLEECKDQGMYESIKAYYDSLAKDYTFVECYDSLKVFLKKGIYKGTYLAFVCYDMKIQGIYTEVPGIGILYMEQNEDDTFLVASNPENEEIQTYVNQMMEDEDVKSLEEDVQKRYEDAIASDALLEEALEDLQNAIR